MTKNLYDNPSIANSTTKQPQPHLNNFLKTQPFATDRIMQASPIASRESSLQFLLHLTYRIRKLFIFRLVPDNALTAPNPDRLNSL
jgi:hypothetical protein